MEEEEDMSPPFWLQNGGGDRRRLSRSYSMFITSGVFFILLLVTSLVFIFVVVPTLHSFSSNIFNKPHNSVKKSWDSLNLVLVLFAIFCGFLSRNNNTNESPRSYEDQTIQTFSDTNTPQEYEKPNPEETPPPPVPRPWYEYSDHRTTYNRLRSFRSYPDLRQESLWLAGDERWRFYDDTRVNGYRGLDSDAEEEEEEEEKEKEEETGTIKNIEVDTFVARGGRNTERTYRPETIEKQRNNAPKEESLNYYRTGKKNRGASATKELLTSLKGKKKKKKKQSVENSQSIPPPPPPPLPPPPSSVFHNLFSSKKSKHKKLHSASSSSSPPPPQKHHVPKPVHVGVATHKPRVSNKGEDFFAFEENVVMTGNGSPLIPIPPPPPPPPPFKMPAWKFRVQGDYVRIDSMSSTSDSGSPELDEVGESPRSTTGEPSILLVYPNPSPDVDSKADNFIESFRAGLKMEKMKSIKEKKQGIRRSNLYSSPKDETGQPSWKVVQN